MGHTEHKLDSVPGRHCSCLTQQLSKQKIQRGERFLPRSQLDVLRVCGYQNKTRDAWKSKAIDPAESSWSHVTVKKMH